MRVLTESLLLSGSMILRFLLVCSLLVAPAVLGAQEVVTLSQGLVMGLDASQASEGGSSAHALGMQSDYRIDVGMPIFTYRLGALNLGGNLNWIWQNANGERASALSLNTFGVTGTLFPYKPYQFTFDFSRTTSPDLFGGGKSRADAWGLGYSYQGRILQRLRMDYRVGTTSGLAQGDFSSFSIMEDQHIGNTDLQFQGERLVYNSGGTAWRYNSLYTSAYSPLSKDWLLLNHLRFQTSQDNRQTQFSSSLMGRPGSWTSVTSLDASQDVFSLQTNRNLAFNQSLAHTWGRLSAFTVAGVSTSSQSGDGPVSRATHLTLGGAYKLTQTWSLLGDVSSSWVRNAGGPAELVSVSGQPRTLHAGLTWGGTLPDQLRHLLFYWTNLQFQRRLAEDYPPGYLPQEMAQILALRHREQEGPLGFSTDFTRTDNDLGHVVWNRMRGSLSLGMGLMVQVMGDLRRDVGFSNQKSLVTEQNLNLYVIQRLGRGSLSFSYGHGQNEQSVLSQDPVPAVALGASTSSTNYSLGWNTFVASVPLGAYLVRSIDAQRAVTNRLAAYSDAGFGRLRFRIQYQHGWNSSGARSDQINIFLVRTFDTIALWGLAD